jgi:hypothetical protein
MQGSLGREGRIGYNKLELLGSRIGRRRLPASVGKVSNAGDDSCQYSNP